MEPNTWFAKQARLILAERRDAQILPRLRQQVLSNQSPRLALQSFWALYVSGGFDDKLASELLAHSNENVRAWSVRLLGDSRKVSPAIQRQWVAAARSDASPIVRAQLACSAKRLRGEDALPILAELLGHDEDATDRHIPLLIWWALEDKAIANRERLIELLAAPKLWGYAKIGRAHV